MDESRGRYVNDRQQFELTSAEEFDEGRYSCLASNDAGQAEKDLLVQVLCKFCLLGVFLSSFI